MNFSILTDWLWQCVGDWRIGSGRMATIERLASAAEPPRAAATGRRRLRLAGPGGAPGRRGRRPQPRRPILWRPARRIFPRRARRVIFLFMPGGPSQVDTFDPKPRLDRDHGKPSPKLYLGQTRKLLASPWKFRKHGESGLEVSELFPHVGSCADQLCVIRSMVGDDVNHPGGCLQMNTGERVATRPSLGAWVTYGLGTENQNLPGFIAIGPGPLIEGARQYGAAFLPAAYQGTFVSDLRNPIRNLKNARVSPARQRRELDALRRLNELHREDRPEDSRLSARIESFELAYRMQREAPDAFDLVGETRGDEAALRHRSTSRPTSSAASACWRAGWSSAACGSCSSTTPPAASSRGTSTAT